MSWRSLARSVNHFAVTSEPITPGYCVRAVNSASLRHWFSTSSPSSKNRKMTHLDRALSRSAKGPIRDLRGSFAIHPCESIEDEAVFHLVAFQDSLVICPELCRLHDLTRRRLTPLRHSCRLSIAASAFVFVREAGRRRNFLPIPDVGHPLLVFRTIGKTDSASELAGPPPAQRLSYSSWRCHQ
jgi:hypothetical protein